MRDDETSIGPASIRPAVADPGPAEPPVGADASVWQELSWELMGLAPRSDPGRGAGRR